mmetsp:Transcript_25023/g.48668  ORF Transcript_25023/g.48668 Transcript_25023/m.48668 type:complete len:334 (+) Transcript_25023:145-1146(+)
MALQKKPRGDGRGGVPARYLGDGRSGHADIARTASGGAVPQLELSRVSSSYSVSQSHSSAPSTYRQTARVCLDPISLKRERHAGLAGDVEVLEDPTREPSPLPDLKPKMRGMAIGLRSDGVAAMVPSLQVYPKKAGIGSRLASIRGKTDNAMAAIHNKLRAQHDFHLVIDQVVAKTRRLPKIHTNVVVRLNRPFLGFRAEGRVNYIGSVPEEGPGIWLGLALEKGVGMHDGMGYFQCKQSPGSLGPFYGVFVRGSQIEFCDKLTDNLHKEGVRLLPPQTRNLKSIKFWKDPFRKTAYPPMLSARPHQPYVPGLSVTNNPLVTEMPGRGFNTAR